MIWSDRARRLLGVIRLVNGTLALLAPRWLLTMFRVDPDSQSVAIYAFRLFGVRTILLGLDLLTAEGDPLEHAVRRAPIIHATDTAAAVLAGLSGELPKRAAVTATLISAINTKLAYAARRGLDEDHERDRVQ
jgi:hypothetical protein